MGVFMQNIGIKGEGKEGSEHRCEFGIDNF